MSVLRVSTFANTQSLLQDVTKTQASLYNSQLQVSSGFKSNTYDGLNGSVEQFTSLNSLVSRLDAYTNNNAIISSRLNATKTSLDQIIDIGTSVKNLIAGRLNPATSSSAFRQQLTALRDQLSNQLNATSEGHFLFSGTDTSTPPIKSPFSPPITLGTPDTTYYQGSQSDYTARIADNQSITYNVRANDPAFQKLYAGIAQALDGDATGSTAALAHSEDLVADGLEGVIAVQATVNGNILNIQQVNGQNQSLQLYYKGVTDTISKTDVVAVSTQVAQDQSILQASFQIFARIVSLRLSDYLK